MLSKALELLEEETATAPASAGAGGGNGGGGGVVVGGGGCGNGNGSAHRLMWLDFPITHDLSPPPPPPPPLTLSSTPSAPSSSSSSSSEPPNTSSTTSSSTTSSTTAAMSSNWPSVDGHGRLCGLSGFDQALALVHGKLPPGAILVVASQAKLDDLQRLKQERVRTRWDQRSFETKQGLAGMPPPPGPWDDSCDWAVSQAVEDATNGVAFLATSTASAAYLT